MSSGVRQADSPEKRLVATMLGLADVYTQELKAAPGAYSTRALAGPELATPTGNFLNKGGDFMIGPFGNEHRIVTVSSGKINVSRQVWEGYAPYLYVNSAHETQLDLHTIEVGAGELPNRELWIQAASPARTLNIVNATDDEGNICTPDGEDLELAPGQIIKLIYSSVILDAREGGPAEGDPGAVSNKWVVVASSTGIGGSSDVGALADLSDVTIADATLTAAEDADPAQTLLLAYDTTNEDWRPLSVDGASGLGQVFWTWMRNDDTAPETLRWLRLLSRDFRNFWDHLTTDLGTGVNSLAIARQRLGTMITNAVSWFDTSLSTVAGSIWGSLKTSYSWLADTVADVASNIWTSLKSSYSWLGDTISTVAGNVWTNLKSSYTWLGDTLSTVAGSIWTSLKGSYTWLENTVSAVAGNIWTSLKSSYSWLENTVSETAAHIWTSLKGTYSWLEDTVSAVAGNIWTSLKSSYTWLKDGAAAVVTALGSALETAYSNLTGTFAAISTAAAAWLDDIGQDAITALTNAGTWFGNLASGAGSFLAGLGGILGSVTPPSGSGSSATPGDLDLNTYDISNVDRIFFESNDRINFSSNFAHISSRGSGSSDTASMEFYVDDDRAFRFFIGSATSQLLILDDRIQTHNRLRLGIDSVTVDGDISRNSSGDVLVRSGGSQINMSSLGEYTPPDRADKIPVSTHATYLGNRPSVSTNQLNSMFGSGNLAVGLIIPENFTVADWRKVWLVWKAGGSGSGLKTWMGHPFTGLISTFSGAGDRHGDQSFSQRSLPNTASATAGAPSQSVFSGSMSGTWGVFYDNNTAGDSYLVIYHGAGTQEYERRENNFGSTSGSGQAGQLPSRAPFVSGTISSATAADDAFGRDDGYIGTSRTGGKNYFWAKIAGYWCYMEVDI